MAHREIHQCRDLHRDVNHLVVARHVGEEALEVDLLLEAGAEQLGGLHAGDGQHGHVVELGVVEAVQQMDPAGTGGGEAHAEPAGRLGVSGGHEGGGLLVVDEDEADLVPVAAQALHDPVDAVAGQSEDGVDAPGDETFDEQLGSNFPHGPLLYAAAR